ncbi:MAG TPA: hypothetical protein VEK76_05705 [Candidatus Binatia bacterium]|nr:hypothetical protein [Candidatus Binatia bacterium]
MLPSRPGEPLYVSAAPLAWDAEEARRGRSSRLLLPPLLLLACAGYTAALGLPWHRRFVVPPGAWETVRGIDAETWLVAAAAVCLMWAALFLVKRPGFFSKVAMALTTLLLLTVMISDYFDWKAATAAANNALYCGPGYYLAFGSAGVVLLGTVLAWLWAEPL